MTERIARHLCIEGRVQGVGYRDWLVACATAEGLDGWVRNRRDDTVEALLYGEPGAVERVIAHCHRGPALANVIEVQARPSDERPDAGFVTRRTV